jgi:hypothetical protein
MNTVLDHPANVEVIRSLGRKTGMATCILASEADHDPYLWCGSHPDIVGRIWDDLGRGMPPSSRRILCGTPVLVDPDTGVVLAMGYGTNYALRLPDGSLPTALQAGCKTSQRWSDGHVTDLAVEFGENWIFGCWAKAEETWCRTVVTSMEASTP